MKFKPTISTLAIGIALASTAGAGPNPKSNGTGSGFDSKEAAMISGIAGYQSEPACPGPLPGALSLLAKAHFEVPGEWLLFTKRISGRD